MSIWRLMSSYRAPDVFNDDLGLLLGTTVQRNIRRLALRIDVLC